MEAFNFEKLSVWQKSRQLVCEVYKLTATFPNTERFALCDQLQRAIVSVSSNIAEGNSRFSTKERVHFIEIAYGSLMEAYCQVQLAVDLNYLQPNVLEAIKPKFQEVGMMLSGLRKSLQEKRAEG